MRALTGILSVVHLLTVCSLSAHADWHNPISGDISSKVIEANQQYSVRDSIIIPSKTHVELPPGTVFLFSDGAQFHIHGSLSVLGTRSAPVVFTSAHDPAYTSAPTEKPTPFSWEGIRISESSDSVTIRNASIQYARSPLEAYGAGISLHSVIRVKTMNRHFLLNGKEILVAADGPFSYPIQTATERLSATSSSSRTSTPKDAGGFRIGLKALVGLNISRLRKLNNFEDFMDDVDIDVDYGMRAGFTFGTAVNMRFTRALSIEPGIVFTIKGFRLDANETIHYSDDTDYSTSELDYTRSAEYRFTYLEFPVNLKYHLPLPGLFQLAFFAGPTLGLNLSSSSTMEYSISNANGLNISDEEEFDLYDSDDTEADMRRLEICLAFGVESALRLGPGEVFLNLHLLPGVSNMIDYDYSEPEEDDAGSIAFEDRVTIGSFRIMSGYMFLIGGDR